MAILKWDAAGQRKVENGVSKGVLYPKGKSGVAWNGLTAVTEKYSGGDFTSLYADNNAYGFLASSAILEATIEAYTYPDEFSECDGSAVLTKGIRVGGQQRKYFDFCYRTEIFGANGEEIGYKLHLIYNAVSSPSELAYKSIDNATNALVFSWDIKCLPIEIDNARAASIISIDSTEVEKNKLQMLEDILYGTSDSNPKMPTPNEVLNLIKREDLYDIFLRILSKSGLWKWDTFNFEKDTIPIAIEREAGERIYYEPSSTSNAPLPFIAYSLLSNTNGSRHYMIIIGDTVNPSSYATDLKQELSLQNEQIVHRGNAYYFTYDLYI